MKIQININEKEIEEAVKKGIAQNIKNDIVSESRKAILDIARQEVRKASSEENIEDMVDYLFKQFAIAKVDNIMTQRMRNLSDAIEEQFFNDAMLYEKDKFQEYANGKMDSELLQSVAEFIAKRYRINPQKKELIDNMIIQTITKESEEE